MKWYITKQHRGIPASVQPANQKVYGSREEALRAAKEIKRLIPHRVVCVTDGVRKEEVK
jgi:hypothetical protein